MSDFQPIICVDFDGVIHSYEKGWQKGVIYGTAVPGFFKWAIQAVETFKLAIYSTRSKTTEGRSAMVEWFTEQAARAQELGEVPADYEWGRFVRRVQFVHEKPIAFLSIDDRAFCFRGNWEDPQLIPENILNFKSWVQN